MVLSGEVAGLGPRFRGETVVLLSRPQMYSVGERHSSQSPLLFSCAVCFSNLI